MEPELKAELKMLRDGQKGLELLAVASLLPMRSDQLPAIEDTLEMLRVMDAYATTAFSEGTALPIRNVIDLLQVLTSEDIDPKLALAALAAQYADAGSDRRDALRTWLSQATEGEISDDLRRLLRQLLDSGRSS